MTTQLAIYNQALIELGERTLSSVSEDIESRRVIDEVYDEVIAYCLEAGQWNFAIRTVEAASDTGIDPNFGYKEVFAKPSDWVRTVGLSGDEYNALPLVDAQYKDENGAFFTDTTPIYLRYVSNGASYGTDLSKWPESFARFVILEIAYRACKRIPNSSADKEMIGRDRDKARRFALSKDAMNEGVRFPTTGRLVRSRGGSDTDDRGSRSRFTG